MFAKSLIAASLTLGMLGAVVLVPTTLPSKDSEVARPTCCMKHAYCCSVKRPCCRSAAPTVAFNNSVAKPTCCIKRAYCCSVKRRCCPKSADAADVAATTHSIPVVATTEAAKSTCCIKRAYCCSINRPCCGGSTATGIDA